MHFDIAYTINKEYIKYFLVSIAGLLRNNSEENFALHILSADLDNEDKQFILKYVNPFEKECFFYDVKDLDSFSQYIHSGYGLEVFLRLFLPWTLKDVEKVLYIDADTLIKGNICKYLKDDLTGFALAGVSDSLDMQVLVQKRNDLFMRDNDYSYFNAGVMIWNLEFIRQNHKMEDFLKVIDKFGDKLLFNDQDILNYLFYKKIKNINDFRFNLMTEPIKDDIDFEDLVNQADIVHYAGTNPWKYGKKNRPDYDLWWSEAKETDMYQDIVEKTLINVARTIDNEIYDNRVYREYALYKLSGTGITKKPLLRGCNRIVLYGAGAWCRLFLDELGASSEMVTHIIGKNVGDVVKGYVVEAFEDNIDEINNSDALIITPLQLFDEIYDLVKDIIKVKIINLADVWK